jgi:site-specific DNA recombinase
MLVGIYTRVSTQEQTEGYSLSEQESRLKAYCTARGWVVYNVYSDAGFSGGNTNRPALQKLINDIKHKKLDTVVVYKLDRLSRSQKDTLTIIEDIFISNDINFISINENFDTSTPFGKAMIGVLSVFAQLERDTIKERMRLGAIGRAKNGYFHGGGYYPIGYDYIDGNLVINEYEALQVREIYDLFLKGYPIGRIRKIMASKYTNKYGNWYSDSTVKSCLTTPIYYGKITYAGELYDGRHDPIVSEELFDKVQARLKELDSTRTERAKTPFKTTKLLGGIIYCQNCGARYYSHHVNGRKHLKDHKGWDYYTCYSRSKSHKRMIKDPNCKSKNWRVDEVDKIVIDEILKLQFDESYIKSIIEAEVEEDNREDILNARINEVSTQLDKIMDLYQLGGVPLDKIAERIDKLTKERTTLETELENIKNDREDNKKISLTEVNDILKNASTILESNDMDAKRMLVHSLIEYIEIGDTIKIHWAF